MLWLKAPESRGKLQTAAGVAVIVILVIILCIINSLRLNIQNRYAKARSEVGDELYTQLYTLCQTYDQVSIPGQNVQDVLLPKMKSCCDAALTLNTALSNAFTTKYRLLTQEDIDLLTGALSAYDNAFLTGSSTDDAQEQMAAACQRVRERLEERYSTEGIRPGKG